ncbi:AraC family ligand binding domain-containing protein (plasmid) [Achromobacter denitrificans]
MHPISEYTDPEPHQIDRPVVAASISLVTDGEELPPHRHRKAQLLFTLSGVITCETERGVWMVPPGCAVWIPGARATVRGHRERCAVMRCSLNPMPSLGYPRCAAVSRYRYCWRLSSTGPVNCRGCMTPTAQTAGS